MDAQHHGHTGLDTGDKDRRRKERIEVVRVYDVGAESVKNLLGDAISGPAVDAAGGCRCLGPQIVANVAARDHVKFHVVASFSENIDSLRNNYLCTAIQVSLLIVDLEDSHGFPIRNVHR
jgi:hypothetical protein